MALNANVLPTLPWEMYPQAIPAWDTESFAQENNSAMSVYTPPVPYSSSVDNGFAGNGSLGNFTNEQNTTDSGLPNIPLYGGGYDVTSNSITQFSNYCTTSTRTVERNNASFEENVIKSVCVQRTIFSDGSTIENESQLSVHSYMDSADGVYQVQWSSDEPSSASYDHYNTSSDREESQSDGDNAKLFSCSEQSTEETYYKNFYIGFKPRQFNLDDMEFEYIEDYNEFFNYDLNVNFPEQTEVLESKNFQYLLDKIIPSAKENGRLVDVEMLASSHTFDFQMKTRTGRVNNVNMNFSENIVPQIPYVQNDGPLCLEYKEEKTDDGTQCDKSKEVVQEDVDVCLTSDMESSSTDESTLYRKGDDGTSETASLSVDNIVIDTELSSDIDGSSSSVHVVMDAESSTNIVPSTVDVSSPSTDTDLEITAESLHSDAGPTSVSIKDTSLDCVTSCEVIQPTPLSSDGLKDDSANEATSIESSTADQPTRTSRWRRYLRRMNIFAGAICSQIVLCYVRGHFLL